MIVSFTLRFKESKTIVSKLEQFSLPLLSNVRLFREVKSNRDPLKATELVMENVEFALRDPVNAFWKVIDCSPAISTWESSWSFTSTGEIANIGTEETRKEQ